MTLAEVYTLQPGDQFSFTETGEVFQVDQQREFIDYEGDAMMMYRDEAHLYAHINDHTKVWKI